MTRQPGWGISLAVILVAAGWLLSPMKAAADPPGPAVQPPNSLCLICHGQEGLTSTGIDGHERPVDAVEAEPFAASAHGELACAKCHPGQAPLPHPDWKAVASAKLANPVACQECHEDAFEAYMRSVHGTLVELGDARAPGCADCHGDSHKIRPAAEWTGSDRAQACAQCHSGATPGFTKALSHEEPSPDSLAASYFAGRFLIILTSAVLAFGIIHVELQVLRWLAQKRGSASRRSGTHGH